MSQLRYASVNTRGRHISRTRPDWTGVYWCTPCTVTAGTVETTPTALSSAHTAVYRTYRSLQGTYRSLQGAKGRAGAIGAVAIAITTATRQQRPQEGRPVPWPPSKLPTAYGTETGPAAGLRW